VEIGSRPSGSEAEAQAAHYIRDQLAGYGYTVTLQGFNFDVFSDAGTTLEVTKPTRRTISAYPLQGSVGGLAEGELMSAGLGRSQDFPADARGKIVLIERGGGMYLGDKAANAAAAGAVAAIIYNNERGPFTGQMQDPVPIPVVSVSREEGQAILDLLGSGPVSVRLDVRTLSGPRYSQNAVARPPGGECQVMVGGHYDSVAVGPGANDNASGTATVLEMARVLAADGEFDDVCFILFGAEEIGLIGSREFVQSLNAEERRRIGTMLNFDMVGVGSRWLLVGSPELRDLAAMAADRLGLTYEVSNTAPAGLGSDHSSFINVGIPAIFFHRLGDPRYHTAQDQAEFVQGDRLAEIGEVGLAVIEALLEAR